MIFQTSMIMFHVNLQGCNRKLKSSDDFQFSAITIMDYWWLLHPWKLPSWELTYPVPAGTFESMIFRLSRLVGYVIPWRVICGSRKLVLWISSFLGPFIRFQQLVFGGVHVLLRDPKTEPSLATYRPGRSITQTIWQPQIFWRVI